MSNTAKKVVPMLPARLPTVLRARVYETAEYTHICAHGVTFEMVTTPAYWTHVAKSVKPFDEIFVKSEDQSFYAHLMVTAVGSREVHTATISHVKLSQPGDVEVDDVDAEVTWRGPSRKWSVVRKSDKEVLRDSFENKEIAQRWLKNRVQNMDN